MDERTKERDEAYSTKIIRMCKTHKLHNIERLKITQAASPTAYLGLTSFFKMKYTCLEFEEHCMAKKIK